MAGLTSEEDEAYLLGEEAVGVAFGLVGEEGGWEGGIEEETVPGAVCFV